MGSSAMTCDSRFAQLEVGNLRDDNNTKAYERIFAQEIKDKGSISPNLSFWIEKDQEYFIKITPKNKEPIFSFIRYPSNDDDDDEMDECCASYCDYVPCDVACDREECSQETKREQEDQLNRDLYVLMKKRESERYTQDGGNTSKDGGNTSRDKSSPTPAVPPNSPEVERIDSSNNSNNSNESNPRECIITIDPEDLASYGLVDVMGNPFYFQDDYDADSNTPTKDDVENLTDQTFLQLLMNEIEKRRIRRKQIN